MQLEDYFEFEKFGQFEKIKVKGTRVPIEVLLEEFNRGESPEKIQCNYPTVTREQVYATITYYLHNQQEMDAYLRRSAAAAEEAFLAWKLAHKPSPVEERLRELRRCTTADEWLDRTEFIPY